MGLSLADMIVAAVTKQTEVESACLRLVTLRGKQWMHETTLAKVPAASTMADVKTLFREKGIYSVGALYPSIKGEPLREEQTVKEVRDQVFEDEAGHLVLYTRV